MAILAAFDLYKTYVSGVLLNIVLGAWVAVSPWLVMSNRMMSASLLITGLATVVLGLWELRSDPELHRQWKRSGTAS